MKRFTVLTRIFRIVIECLISQPDTMIYGMAFVSLLTTRKRIVPRYGFNRGHEVLEWSSGLGIFRRVNL